LFLLHSSQRKRQIFSEGISPQSEKIHGRRKTLQSVLQSDSTTAKSRAPEENCPKNDEHLISSTALRLPILNSLRSEIKHELLREKDLLLPDLTLCYEIIQTVLIHWL